MKQARLKGPERRARLLDAAAEIVLAHGVAAVTMDGVAQRNGVDRAIAYRHFCDRDHLLAELLAREHQRHLDQIHADLIEDPTIRQYVPHMLRGWFRQLDAKGELFLRLFHDAGPLAAAAKALRRQEAERWAGYLEDAYGLARAPALQLAALLVGGTFSVLEVRGDADDEMIIENFTTSILGAARALRRDAERRAAGAQA